MLDGKPELKSGKNLIYNSRFVLINNNNFKSPKSLKI